MQRETSETDIEIRRTTWRQIRDVAGDQSISDLEKLRKLYHISSIYAALTGDTELFPPQIRSEQSMMLAWVKVNVEKIEKRKSARARDVASGQNMLC